MIDILYIEDDPEDVIIVKRILKHKDIQFTIQTAATGKEARQKLIKQNFHCVLLDHNLPDTNGLALLHDIKQSFPQLPVIMLTGQKDERLTLGSSKLGAVKFLTKDEIRSENLIKTILQTTQITDGHHQPKRVPFSHIDQIPFSTEDSETVYRTLVETMTEGLISIDCNKVVLFCNHQIEELLNWGCTSLIGQRVDLIFGEDERELFEQVFEHNKKGRSIKYELQLTRKNGKPLPVLISQSPQYDKTNAFIGSLLVVTDFSERKRAENELAESEKRFRHISENITDLIWETDTTGKFTYLNPIVKNILGFEVNEVRGKYIYEFTEKSGKEHFRALFENILNRRKPNRSMYKKFQHQQGQIVYLEMSGIPVFDVYGNFIAYRGISRDITDRKLREIKLQKEREYERNLEKAIVKISTNLFQIENFDISIKQILEIIGDTLKIDRSYLYHVSKDERYLARAHEWISAESKNHKKIVSQIRLNRSDEWLSRLKDNKVFQICDTTYLSDSLLNIKRLFFRNEIVSFMAIPILVNNQFHGFLGVDNGKNAREWKMTEIVALRMIVENISKAIDRKNAREFLNYQKLKFESVIKNSHDGIILLDSHLKIDLINPVGRKMLRCLTSSKNGKDKLTKLGALSLSNIWTELTENKLDTYREEIHAINKSNRTFNATFTAVKNARQLVTGLIVNLHEITELLQTQEQLMQSSKLASLGQLAAGVAHELNNPLTTMIGYAQLIAMKNKSPEWAENLNKIIADGKRAKTIIENMLEFSHSQKPKKELVDINKTIHDTITLLGKQLVIHNIELVENYALNLAPVYCDRGQIQQVFLNLLQNAFDAIVITKKGDKITIKTKHSSEKNLIVEVHDNGPGMPEDVRQRVFDPFYTTKPPGQGTGLGLSISYKIIQRHEGKIQVSSEQGKGTTFTITLPTKVHQIGGANYRHQVEKEKILPPALKGKIEIFNGTQKDDSISKILFNAGHEVIYSSNISKLLQDIREDSRDITIINIQEFSKIKSKVIQRLGRSWKSRFILVAHYEISANVKQSFEKEEIIILAKPINGDDLLTAVTQILQKNHHNKELRRKAQ